ncbi:MAG: flagellar biosynthetic protein FliR [Desulforegulaceae bacterium]|nr:flagellar biosynthetic protein FliR [Desulforegulaceae bacterium]
MEILNLFSPEEFKHFLLILLRVSVILFLFPIYGSEVIPVMVKAGLSLVITLCLYSIVHADPLVFPEKVFSAPVLVVTELFIGLCLSLGVRLFFSATQVAGVLIGFQMGFSMINVVDPQSGSQVSIMDQVAYWVVMVVFLLCNGHHVIITALVESFRILPIGGQMFLEKGLFDMMGEFGEGIFIIAIKLGAPVIGSLFFTSVAFGIISKFSPQINVMIVAFPVKIIIGLLLFGFMLEVASYFTHKYVSDFYGVLIHTLNFLSGKAGVF